MKMYRLHHELWIPRPIDEVYSFFADARNLERITPHWLHFEATSAPAAIQLGSKIDYRLRIHGIPIRWQSEISAWDPPTRFIDTQTIGPYRRWIHEHTFAVRDGGTMVHDDVQYAPRGGWLVNRLLVARDLKRIFNYRRDRLEALLSQQDG